jgi:hypothetical protein
MIILTELEKVDQLLMQMVIQHGEDSIIHRNLLERVILFHDLVSIVQVGWGLSGFPKKISPGLEKKKKMYGEEKTRPALGISKDWVRYWIVIIGIVLLGVIGVVIANIVAPDKFQPFKDQVNALVDAKEVEVYRQINVNKALLPSTWTREVYSTSETSPRLEMRAGNGTAIATMTPRTSASMPSHAMWRKTGTYVELHFVFCLSQGNNSALTSQTNLKLIYTLPVAMASSADPANNAGELVASSILHSIDTAASNPNMVIPKKIVTYVYSRKSSSVTECDKICIDMYFDSSSIYGVSLTGSIHYPILLATT